MTDKTSTAPVMSLQQVRDALQQAHNSPGLDAVLDSCVAAIDEHLTSMAYQKPVADVVIPDGSAHSFARLNVHLPHGTQLYAAPILSAPTPDVVGGDVVAWVTPEGDRSITAAQKAQGERDGGGSASSVRPFSVPAYASPRVQGDAEEVADKQIRCIAACIADARYVSHATARNEAFLKTLRNALFEAGWTAKSKGDYPECSGDASSCPENEGYGCCGAKAHPAEHTRGDVVASTVNGTPVSAEVWALAKSKHPHNGDMKVGYAHGYAEALTAAPRQAVPDGLDLQTLIDAAKTVGAEIDGGDDPVPNVGYAGYGATVTFDAQQIVAFVGLLSRAQGGGQ